MSFTIYGTIAEVLPEETGTSSTGNNWRTLTFAIKTGGLKDDPTAFILRGAKIDEFAHLLVPQTAVGVTFYPPSSRRWQRDASSPVKYFTDLIASSVVPAAAQQQAVPQYQAPQAQLAQSAAPQQAQSQPQGLTPPQGADELPF